MPELNDTNIFENLNLTQTYVREIIQVETGKVVDSIEKALLNNIQPKLDAFKNFIDKLEPEKFIVSQQIKGSKLITTLNDGSFFETDMSNLFNGVMLKQELKGQELISTLSNGTVIKVNLAKLFGDLTVLKTIDKTELVKAINEIFDSLTAHNNDNSNPHKVTKAQVGLNNVDNTSDLAKPISTATKTYIDQQDGLKADKKSVYTKTETDGLFAKKSSTIAGYGITDTFSKEETYNKTDIDNRINSISGGYFKAFSTLKDLQSAVGMVANQVAKVMNDPVIENNGDYFYNGVKWIKGYNPLIEAKEYVKHTGLAKLVSKSQDNINYLTEHSKLVLSNEVWVVTGHNVVKLTTPIELLLYHNKMYRIEYNLTNNSLFAVDYNLPRTEGVLVVGFVNVTSESIITNDFLYCIDNIPQNFNNIVTSIIDETESTDNLGRKVVVGITDENNAMGAWVADDGTINASNIYTENYHDVAWGVVDENNSLSICVDEGGNFNIGSNITVIPEERFTFSITDNDGRAALLIDKKGKLISLEILELQKKIMELSYKIENQLVNIAPMSLIKTDYIHVFSYGQSLSRGTMCFNPINTQQPYNNVMFGGSTTSSTPSGQLDRDFENNDYSKFIPLIAQDNNKGEAESPVCGFANGFVELQLQKGDNANQWKMVGTACGEGGRSVSYLSKGMGGRYEDLLKQVNAAKNVANGLGQSYSVWAVAWTQAEQDYADNTSRNVYKKTLIALHDNLKTDIQLITGQPFKPLMICYQVASHRYYEKLRNDLALALLDASFERNDIMIACPMYQFEYSQDSLHLIAETSQQLGKYYARALDYVKTTGKKWQPLQVKNIIVQGRIIDIEFNKLGLVLDTTLVTKTHNYGFDIWQGDVLQNIIASVTVIDKNRVRIVLNADLPVDSYLSYARGRNGDPYKSGRIDGARGNLRDSNGDTDNYTDRQGVKYMHNWCVAFENKLN